MKTKTAHSSRHRPEDFPPPATCRWGTCSQCGSSMPCESDEDLESFSRAHFHCEPDPGRGPEIFLKEAMRI